MKKSSILILVSILIFFPSILFMADFPISTVANNQELPAIAWDGTNHLVVWTDYRNENYDIYAQLVSPSGNLVGSGFAISTAINTQERPDIAWDGTNYLVVWEDERNGVSNYDIYGQLVSASGTLVGSNFSICLASNTQTYAAVAWDGTNYLVVWGDEDIYGQLVSPSGALVGSNFAISTATNWQYWPEIAFDGTNYLVVWQDYRSGDLDVYGQLVSPSGILIGSNFVISTAANDQWFPSLAWNGTNYLVVWQDYRSGIQDIYGQLVSPSGALVGSNFIISTTPDWKWWPDVAWDGTNFLAIWEDRRIETYDIFGQRINPSGELVGGNFLINTTSGMSHVLPALDWDGNHYLVAWQHNSLRGSDIYGNLDVGVAGIELLSFSASPTNTGILLTWFASLDENGICWVIERGHKKDGDFHRITTIPIKGSAPHSERFKYEDNSVIPGVGYYYRLGKMNLNDKVEWLSTSFAVAPLGTGIPSIRSFPEPSNGKAKITFSIPAKSFVNVEIYNNSGQLVRTILRKPLKKGDYRFKWDGKNSKGMNVPSGCYFVKVESKQNFSIKKITLLR